MSSKKTVPLSVWQEIEEMFERHCSDELSDNQDWRPDWGEFEDFACNQLMKLGICYDDPYDDLVLHYAEYFESSKKQRDFIDDWFGDMLSNWEHDWQIEQAIQHESRCYR